MVKITFNSSKDVENTYQLFVKSLSDAIKLNIDNYDKLEEIRLELLNNLELVKSLQGKLRHGR